MKKSIIFAIATIAALFTQNTFAATNHNTNTNISKPLGGGIILRAGTTISFKLAEEVHSEDCYVNNALRFKVQNNVMVNGKIIIATNAYAEGTITKVKRGSDGHIAEIHIVLETVQAVDGSRVDLDPSPHVVKANFIFDEAVINMGTLCRAHTLNDTKH